MRLEDRRHNPTRASGAIWRPASLKVGELAYYDGTSKARPASVSNLTRALRVLAGLVCLLGTACGDTVDPAPDEPAEELPPAEEPVPLTAIQWDPQSQMIQVASTAGCDSWTPTWAPDDNLYTAFGDCRPDGVPHKIGMGFGRISGATAETVSFTMVPTGDPNDWDDAALGAGVEAVGDDSASHKAAGMLHDGARLWYWIRNISSTGTGVRLKFSDNYDSTNPAFTWVDWSLPEVGYASFVQYGQGYTGGPADYVYAVIPMSSSAAGSVSSSAYELVPGFGLLRGSRSDLTQQASWEYFCGTAEQPGVVLGAECGDPGLSCGRRRVHAPGRHELEPGHRALHVVAGVRSRRRGAEPGHPVQRRTHGAGGGSAVGPLADGVFQRKQHLARRHQHRSVRLHAMGLR